jgi:hypothetical protein
VDGGAWVNVQDQAVLDAPDLGPGSGRIISYFNFTDGSGETVTFTTTIAYSKPVIGNPSVSKMDVGIHGYFSGGAHELIVEVTDTGFGPPKTPSGVGELTSFLGGNGFEDLDAYSFTSWVSNTNAEFGPPTFDTDVLTSPGSSSVVGIANAPYSITNRTVVSGVGGGYLDGYSQSGDDFSFNNITTFALPEPASMAMWSLIGGIGAVAGWRRSRRKR